MTLLDIPAMTSDVLNLRPWPIATGRHHHGRPGGEMVRPLVYRLGGRDFLGGPNRHVAGPGRPAYTGAGKP